MVSLKKNKEALWLLNEKYNGIENHDFFEDLKKIESGEPVDYVIGFANFLGTKIDLSYHSLIPRQETEWWVEKAVSLIIANSSPDGVSDPVRNVSVLDLFAGSGCIGISILKHLADTFVDFGEKDPLLIKQIEKNLEINNLPIAGRGSPDPVRNVSNGVRDTRPAVRANVCETDIFTNIPPKKYDYIFANPPYISHDRKWQVAKPVLEYEPHLAIFADDEGLFFVKKLLNEAPEFLTEDGKMFIEFDQWQKEKIEELVNESKFEGEFWKDQNDKWRVVVLSARK